MSVGTTANKDMEFHNAEQFETAMFPRAARERASVEDDQHPRSVGSRLAEEALARLKPTNKPVRRKR